MKQAIKLNISANYCDRDVECIGIGEAEYNPEDKLFWINTKFNNPKGEDDYLTVSFDIQELLRVIGKAIAEPIDY